MACALQMMPDDPIEVPATFGLLYLPVREDEASLSFPCDDGGHVDMNALSERLKANYLLARTLVGRDYHRPVIVTGTAAAEKGASHVAPRRPS